MTIALASAWNPRGELPRFQRMIDDFRDLYDHLAISLHDNGTPEVRRQLEELPEATYISYQGYSGRYACLKLAYESGADFIHYVDMDRVIRWMETRPDELKQVVQRMQETDCLTIGRTAPAYATHPKSLYETEMIPNIFFSHYLGKVMDFAAGSKGFSRAAVAHILDNSCDDNALRMDVEWLILLKKAGFSWDYIEADGLDWESADQFQDQAADAQRQQEIARAYDQDVASWELRVKVAQAITQFGIEAIREG